jgi:glyoxylase I family protein
VNFGTVDHVGLLVEEIDPAKHFLETALGFTEIRTVELDDMRGVFLTAGGVTIELVWVRDPASRATQLGGADRRLDHLALSVPDLDAAVQELGAAGVVTGPVIDTGAYLTTFADPATADGVKYQFVQYKPS